ncbi:MAG: hypothetical protein ACPGQS_13790, partial [Bradymonadia bacterium]
DIHHRVLEDGFGAAGWFLETARQSGVDPELMRCFSDSVRDQSNLDEGQLALVQEGFRFFATEVDGLIKNGGSQDSTYLLAYELFQNAGMDARADRAKEVLRWLGRMPLDVELNVEASADLSRLEKLDLTENLRVKLMEHGVDKSPLFRALDALGQLLGELRAELPPRTSNRLSNRSFRTQQQAIAKLARQLRLPELQVWNGGSAQAGIQARLLPSPALFISREVLESEWRGEELFKLGAGMEGFRFSRGAILRETPEHLVEILSFVWHCVNGSDEVLDFQLDEVLGAKLRNRVARLPLRIVNVIRALELEEISLIKVAAVQSDLRGLFDRMGLIVSGDIGASLESVLVMDSETVGLSRQRGGLSQLLEQNWRASSLIQFFLSGMFDEVLNEMSDGVGS